VADYDKIKGALRQLDPKNDNHWTSLGEPRIDTVRLLVGDSNISRADIDTADKAFNRQAARDAAAPQGGDSGSADAGATAAPAAPTVADAGAPGGTTTGDPVPPPPPAPGEITVTPPVDADGKEQPTDVPPVPAAPAADGLPTAAEPAMVEGGTPTERAQDAETASRDVPDAVVEQGGAWLPPQITQGTTEQGYNALNSKADDLRDAQASTAPSPNAPEALGGAPGARQAGGVTNEAGTDESTEQRPGEAQLSAVDHGADGDADEVASLEEELEAAVANSASLKEVADEARAELDKSVANESRIRQAIEVARPRGGNMEAIQAAFAAADEVAAGKARMRKQLSDAGIDIGKIQEAISASPLDKAMKG